MFIPSQTVKLLNFSEGSIFFSHILFNFRYVTKLNYQKTRTVILPLLHLKNILFTCLLFIFLALNLSITSSKVSPVRNIFVNVVINILSIQLEGMFITNRSIHPSLYKSTYLCVYPYFSVSIYPPTYLNHRPFNEFKN